MSDKIVKTADKEIVVDKHHRLQRQLERLYDLFCKSSSFEPSIRANIDSTSEGDRHSYLRITRHAWFKFPKVIAQVYPVKAGGETINTYDILVNSELVTDELVKFITGIVRDLSQVDDNVKFGTLRYRDTLKPYTNDIVHINETYRPTIFLLD